MRIDQVELELKSSKAFADGVGHALLEQAMDLYLTRL